MNRCLFRGASLQKRKTSVVRPVFMSTKQGEKDMRLLIVYLVLLIGLNQNVDCPVSAVEHYDNLLGAAVGAAPEDVENLFFYKFQAEELAILYPACQFYTDYFDYKADWAVLLALSEYIPEDALQRLGDFYEHNMERSLRKTNYGDHGTTS